MISLFCPLLCPLLHASLIEPGDVSYHGLRQGPTYYIFDPKSHDFIARLAAFNESFHRNYAKSFGWTLDEEQDLILISARQQIANAYATTQPNLKTVWYPSGAGLLEEIAESSWLLTLASHETAHLYQLDVKNPIGQSLHPYLGNAIVIFPFFWPVFLQTNLLLPTSMLEGNAVLNESRFGLGGRLHSGEARALVLAQISSHQINATRLINDEFKFPFGETAYLQGGYFQAHLAAKYGVDKTNAFFKAQTEHYLWPLILNRTFREHFGESYYQEVHEYVHELGRLASRQKVSDGKSLEQSRFTSPLNQDDTRVWWLSDQGGTLPQLNIINKSSGEIERRHLDLPMGKVFFIDGQPKSAASLQHDLHHLEYSLYGESAAFDPNFRSQIVTDRRAEHLVSLDAEESWLDPSLRLDGEVYDIGHSNPVLDRSGNVYYFRQNGPERLLYRNREPVFKYFGYYGKLTEVTADGTIYFIAATELGSSLFRYQNNEISRVLKSDRIVDARFLKDDQVLAIEVNAFGHRSVLTTIEAKSELPTNYTYGFAVETLTPESAVEDSAKAGQEKPYHGLRQLRFSQLDLGTTLSNSGVGVTTALSFNDPLETHAFNLGYAGFSLGDNLYYAEYRFTRLLPDLYIRYFGLKDRDRRQESEVALGIEQPLLRWRRLDAHLNFALNAKNKDSKTYGSTSGFDLGWSVPTSLGFYNWRDLKLHLVNRLDLTQNDLVKEHNTSQVSLQYIHGFQRDWFLSAFSSYSWAEDPDINVRYSSYPLLDSTEVPRLTDHGDYTVAKSVAARLELTRAIEWPFYSSRIPLGLHRIAPLIVAQGIAMDTVGAKFNGPGLQSNSRVPANLFEYGWGADVELLLLHKVPARVRFLYGYDTREPGFHDTQVNFLLKHQF